MSDAEKISALEMCRAFGAYYADKDMIILRAWRAGNKKSVIAREMHLHRGTVERVVTKGRSNVNQANSGSVK